MIHETVLRPFHSHEFDSFDVERWAETNDEPMAAVMCDGHLYVVASAEGLEAILMDPAEESREQLWKLLNANQYQVLAIGNAFLRDCLKAIESGCEVLELEHQLAAFGFEKLA